MSRLPKALLLLLGLGLLSAPFLGLRLVPGPAGGGDRLALRRLDIGWTALGWAAGAGLVAWALRRPLATMGHHLLEMATSRKAALLWLALAVAYPCLPEPWRRAIAVWEPGGIRPLGWLTLETLCNLWLYVVLALGLNLIVGQAGVLVLGYGGFYGIGAYAMALLATGFPCWELPNGWMPYWTALALGLPLGALLAAAAGALVGFPALRLKGDYLAIVTLGFGEVLVLALNNWSSVTGGVNGANITPSMLPPRGSWGFPSERWHYAMGLAVAVLAVLFHARLNRSRFGRALVAIREDETAARAMGIHAPRMKLLAFAIAAAWAGVAGALFAARLMFVTPDSFKFLESVTVLVMVVLGGMGNLRGMVLGAAGVTLLLELLLEADEYRMLAFGLLLVLAMIFRPQGLLEERR